MVPDSSIKRILVTGGNGLVGRGIQYQLRDDGEKSEDWGRLSDPSKEEWIFVGSKDADLRIESQATLLLSRTKPTHVVHLAAAVGGLFLNMNNNLKLYLENQAINHNLLEAVRKQAKHSPIEMCISCLSTCIFPDSPPSYPITEQMIHEGPPHHSNSGYAYAKRNIDILNSLYNNDKDCATHFISIIPTNIYGPHDNFNLTSSHVIPALIRKGYEASRQDKGINGDGTLLVAGTGKPLRQFIYSKDLGKIIIFLLRNYTSSTESLIIAPPNEEFSIKDVSSMIANNLKIPLKFDPSKEDGQFKKTASSSVLLKKVLPSTFKWTPFHEGIKETISWYIDNHLSSTVARL